LEFVTPSRIEAVKDLIKGFGEDPGRDGLEKTPKRFLRSMEYLTSGYRADLDKAMNDAVYSVSYEDMVVVRNIEFHSLCEHHMLPFFGRCHVGYVPNGKVIGLSKIPRLVEIFARRLQVQERLTHEIAQALQDFLSPHGVGVVCEAYHMCMMMRGVEKQNSFTITSSTAGSFRNSDTRSEFMSLVRAPKP
jgi:GTP cyclohydrolase I